MSDLKFRVEYDDMPNDVVDTIADVLAKVGFIVECISPDDADGYMEYEIKYR